jgi:hypothetical protein
LQVGEITLAEAERELKWRAWGGYRGLTYPMRNHSRSERGSIEGDRPIGNR